MVQIPVQPRRRSLRLQQHDYTEPGAYFITVCTKERRCIFGDVVEGQMMLNSFGDEVNAAWRELPRRFDRIELDECVVMPNHFHGILAIEKAASSLSAIVSAFKSLSSFRINLKRGARGTQLWQRGFYDHVVRDDGDLARIREYIQINPARWALDEENPALVRAARSPGGLKPAPTPDASCHRHDFANQRKGSS